MACVLLPGDYITLYHCTPHCNTESILKNGLDPFKSQTRWLEVWLVDATRIEWSAAHVAKRHKVCVADVDCFEITLPARWFRNRFGGIYNCRRYISPDCINSFGPAWELVTNAGSKK